MKIRFAITAPTITLQPVSQTNNVGALVNLSVEATGSRPLIFNWYFKDVQISSFTNGIISFVISSVLESGNYTAVVTNEFGATTSAPAVLTILGPPFFTNQPSPQAIYVTQTATFSAAVTGPATTSVAAATTLANTRNRFIRPSPGVATDRRPVRPLRSGRHGNRSTLRR